MCIVVDCGMIVDLMSSETTTGFAKTNGFFLRDHLSIYDGINWLDQMHNSSEKEPMLYFGFDIASFSVL